MEQLEEELTCPVCCCLFDDPRVLLCSHSFCKKCLEGLLEGHRGPTFRAPLKCPTCRKESPHNGANSLQINYSLRGIVEKYSKIRLLPKTSSCAQHCGQPLNMFCATDLKLICGFCATTDEHREHRFCSLGEAHEREKAACEELLRGVESWRSADTLSCLEALQSGRKRALQSVARDAERVTEYFDKLIGALERKKNEILSDVETAKQAAMQAYDPEISRLSAALEERRRALTIAESFRGVSDESDPLCFLQQMQEFREKFRVLQETTLPAKKELDATPAVRNFDVKKWDSLRLRELDKISVPRQNGSCGVGGSGRRWRWTFMVIAALLLPLLLLMFETLLTPHTALTLTHSGAHLRGLTSMCTAVIGAGQECVINAINAAVTFLGTCKLF